MTGELTCAGCGLSNLVELGVCGFERVFFCGSERLMSSQPWDGAWPGPGPIEPKEGKRMEIVIWNLWVFVVCSVPIGRSSLNQLQCMRFVSPFLLSSRRSIECWPWQAVSVTYYGVD